ncbi:MAG: hypothetical protein AAFY57_18265 [Cyanobacteria bacterium J06642_2]
MPFIRIILFFILAVVTYGILHDQVTARLCIEYFTIAHPPVFQSDSPTLVGLGWGIIGTWWAGLGAGTIVACAARLGTYPKHDVESLYRPVFILAAVMASCALIAGIAGYVFAERGAFELVPLLAAEIPLHKHSRFIANSWAHASSYFFGMTGSITIAIRVWMSRIRLGKSTYPHPYRDKQERLS